MFPSHSRMWRVAAVLGSAALVLGARFRLPDWAGLGTPTGIKEYKATAARSDWNPGI